MIKENKIPNSSIKIDGANKVQAYISFNEDDVRNNLEKMICNDLVTDIKMPIESINKWKNQFK